jgi:hypothetical protein
VSDPAADVSRPPSPLCRAGLHNRPDHELPGLTFAEQGKMGWSSRKMHVVLISCEGLRTRSDRDSVRGCCRTFDQPRGFCVRMSAGSPRASRTRAICDTIGAWLRRPSNQPQESLRGANDIFQSCLYTRQYSEGWLKAGRREWRSCIKRPLCVWSRVLWACQNAILILIGMPQEDWAGGEAATSSLGPIRAALRPRGSFRRPHTPQGSRARACRSRTVFH